MPVYDQTYKHWEGSLKSHSFRWWVITKYGIKTALKKKAIKALFVFALLPFAARSVHIYGLTHIGKVSDFVGSIVGHRFGDRVGGKTYLAAVSGDAGLFQEKLREKGCVCDTTDHWLRITVPEGENSKKIVAIAKQTRTKIARLIPPGVDAGFYNRYLNTQLFFLFLFLLAVGSGLIARDVKFNALQIYLAKPIAGIEYILGKCGIVLFFLATVTVVPAIFLFFLQAIFVGDSLYLRHYWWVLGAICGYSLLLVLSGTLIVLALSALSRDVRSAAFGGAALFWFSPMVAQLLRSSTRNDNYLLLSFVHNWIRSGEKIFGLSGTGDVRWQWSMLILLAIMALCAAALLRRVRAVEVVK